jgi:curved DNA-binding protein CbpA
VRELHPDRYSATPQERTAREEALKRVNAAYDALRALKN